MEDSKDRSKCKWSKAHYFYWRSAMHQHMFEFCDTGDALKLLHFHRKLAKEERERKELGTIVCWNSLERMKQKILGISWTRGHDVEDHSRLSLWAERRDWSILIGNWQAWKKYVGKWDFIPTWKRKRKYEGRNWLNKKIQLFYTL